MVTTMMIGPSLPPPSHETIHHICAEDVLDACDNNQRLPIPKISNSCVANSLSMFTTILVSQCPQGGPKLHDSEGLIDPIFLGPMSDTWHTTSLFAQPAPILVSDFGSHYFRPYLGTLSDLILENCLSVPRYRG